MTPALSRFLLLFVFSLLCLQPALAQQAARATLTGTVMDPNSAVVHGARVIATQSALGVRRETVTNAEGVYVFSDMLPGEYELRVEAAGFNPNVSNVPVLLTVGQSATMNVSLSVNLSDINIVCIFYAVNLGRAVDRKSTRLNSSH